MCQAMETLFVYREVGYPRRMQRPRRRGLYSDTLANKQGLLGSEHELTTAWGNRMALAAARRIRSTSLDASINICARYNKRHP
jgi:hypothetical protein